MNIYDISKKSGYSIATVSRVINQKGSVSEKARETILAVVEELSYIPNAHARGLGGSVQTIGLLCLDVADMYLAGAVSILERELQNKDYHSLLVCTGPHNEDKQKALQLMLAQRVDAVILIGSHFLLEDNSYILEAAKKVPVILLNGYVEGENIYSIMVDDYSIVKECTTSLLEAGHRHLLYLYDKETPSGLKKQSGFHRAIKEYSGKVISYDLFVPHNIATAQQVVAEFLKANDKVSAIMASEDLLAIASLKAAIELGISVPNTLEIIGYNNSLLSQCCMPELTSIDSQMEALCISAISTLFHIFKDKDFPSKTMLSASLIKRKTTKF